MVSRSEFCFLGVVPLASILLIGCSTLLDVLSPQSSSFYFQKKKTTQKKLSLKCTVEAEPYSQTTPCRHWKPRGLTSPPGPVRLSPGLHDFSQSNLSKLLWVLYMYFTSMFYGPKNTVTIFLMFTSLSTLKLAMPVNFLNVTIFLRNTLLLFFF